MKALSVRKENFPQLVENSNNPQNLPQVGENF